MNKRVQAKHVSDADIVAAVRACPLDVCAALPQYPAKVVVAKLGSLVRRGLLRGPRFPRTDERGDYEIIEEAVATAWDKRIEEDASAGRLDAVADGAIRMKEDTPCR